jgi:hypothetical protein
VTGLFRHDTSVGQKLNPDDTKEIQNDSAGKRARKKPDFGRVQLYRKAGKWSLNGALLNYLHAHERTETSGEVEVTASDFITIHDRAERQAASDLAPIVEKAGAQLPAPACGLHVRRKG